MVPRWNLTSTLLQRQLKDQNCHPAILVDVSLPGQMAHYIHVVTEGNVYSCYRRFSSDGEFLQRVKGAFAPVSREYYFDTLYRALSSKWIFQGDIPYPFGDNRERLVASSWVIDLDNDLVILRKECAKHYRTGLRELTQGQELPSLQPVEQAPLPKFTLDSIITKKSWVPDIKTPPRQVAFIGRVLDDFVYQWRHIFRSQYNDSTFRKLAYAILRIVTLDFTVKEFTSGRQGTGPVVRVADLPAWKPIYDNCIDIGHVSVVLCRHFTRAMAAIQEDYGKHRAQHSRNKEHNPSSAKCKRITYLVLSIREVFLCRKCVCGDHSSEYAAPERLFNGIDQPSERALVYLLMAAPSDNFSSPLHTLPMEIQDMILGFASLGAVRSAHIGCLLSIGTPFWWQGPGNTGKIERQEIYTTRPSTLPAESHIYFDEYPTGLLYKIASSHRYIKQT